MRRLTTNEKFPHGAEGISQDKLTGNWCRGEFEATAIVEKLAYYENLAEEGRLIELPVKIGTNVFAIYTGATGKNPIIIQTNFGYELIPLWGSFVFETFAEAKRALQGGLINDN